MKRITTFRSGLEQAIYVSCKHNLQQLAERLQLSAQKVCNKANPNDTRRHFNAAQLVAIMNARQDYRILAAMAAACDHAIVPVEPAPAVGSSLVRLAVLAGKFSDLIYACADALAGRSGEDTRACWAAAASHGLALVQEIEATQGMRHVAARA